MPAESCVERESRYGHMSESSLQKGSEASAERNAGRMCGSGGSVRLGSEGSSFMGVLAGDATDAVDRRDAAIVRRMWDSVERAEVTTHADGGLALCLCVGRMMLNIHGQPLPMHHSSSSVRKHCKNKKAPLASPANASSRSSVLRVHSAASASAEARLNRVTTGMMSACRISRCNSHVSCICESHWLWWSQKLQVH
jgi:hypothetical protein